MIAKHKFTSSSVFLAFNFIFIGIIFSFALIPSQSAAYWVWTPETGKFVNPEGAVQDTAEEQFQYALKLYDEGDREQAIDELRRLLKVYAGARIAPDAAFQLAIFYEEAQEFKKAFDAYKHLVKEYPQYENMREVVKRTYDLGQLFLSGVKRKLAGVPVLSSLPLAVEAFQHIVDTAPFSEYGDKAQYHLGLALRKSGQYPQAVEAFERVVENYPTGELAIEASFQAAETQLFLSSTASRDQQGLKEAEERIETFLKTHPDAPEIERVQELRRQALDQHARKNFDIARYYEDNNFLDSAVIYYRKIVENYPDTPWAEEAERRIKRLNDPVAFWQEESTALDRAWRELLDRYDQISTEINTASATPDAARELELEEQHKQLKTALKENREKREALRARKREDVERRKAVLSRARTELKKRHDALKRKRKALKHVDSEELQSAFTRWEESLGIETESLAREARRLDQLSGELGIQKEPLWTRLMPLRGPKDDWTEILSYGEQEIQELNAQRALLEEKRRDLSDERDTLALQLEMIEVRKLQMLSDRSDGELFAPDQELLDERKKLRTLESSLKELEQQASVMKREYEQAADQPLSGDERDAGRMRLEARRDYLTAQIYLQDEKLSLVEGALKELIERRQAQEKESEVSEEVPSGDAPVEEATEEGVVVEEGETQAKRVPKAEVVDNRTYRLAIRKIEREIRTTYEEIDDHRRIKNQKIDELDGYLHQAEREVTEHRLLHTTTKPFRSFGRLFHAFIYGLEEQETTIQEDATQLGGKVPVEVQQKLVELSEDIEFENIVIATKRQQLFELERELYKTKTTMTSAKSGSFQSLLVDEPYRWLNRTLRLAYVPFRKKDPETILTKHHAREQEKKARLAQALLEIEGRLEAMTYETASETPAPAQTEVVAPEAPAPAAESGALQQIETELQKKRRELEASRVAYEEKVKLLMQTAPAASAQGATSFEREARSLKKELHRMNKALSEVISDEQKVVTEERALILEKLERITRAVEEQKPLSDIRATHIREEQTALEHRLELLKDTHAAIGREESRITSLQGSAAA